MSAIEGLHNRFCDFVDETRRWASPPPGRIFKPSFVFSEFVLGDAIEAMSDADDAEPLPFEEFWLVIDSHLPHVMASAQLGGQTKTPNQTLIVNVRAMDSNDAFNLAIYALSPASGRWGHLRLEKQNETTRRMMEATVEACIFQINRTSVREETTTERLAAVNRGRAKSKHGLEPVPGFIVIRPPVNEPKRESIPTGITQSPHNRRGHWRTMKATGKRFWVRDYPVHGGSIVPRDYVVQN